MEYVKTGISGFDAMLYGGIPKENQVVIAGGPGAGKTLFCFEYLYRNALMGEPGVYMALEETSDRILENVRAAFPGFTKLDELLEKKMLIVDGKDPALRVRNNNDVSGYEFGRLIAEIEQRVLSIKATRVVIDSVSLLEMLVSDFTMYRRYMLALVSNLRRLGVTTLLIEEIPTPDKASLVFKPDFFIFDGIAVMYQSGEADKRALSMEVIKMRGTNHSFVTTPYEITPNGMKLYSSEEFSS